MKILLVGGQPVSTWPRLEEFDYYIGIDRGAYYLMEQGLPCDAAIGDFDSLTSKEQQRVFQHSVSVKKSPAEKDDTDTQLALVHALKINQHADITLIGLTGGRIDHFLANLWLPLEPRFRVHCQQLTIKDSQNTIQYFEAGKYTISKEKEMNYLAYCCLTPVKELTLEGSKYTLCNQDVPYSISYASNEFLTETATFSFKSGLVAVIQSKD